MQPAPPQQPYAQPPSAGRGRFWLGVLTGGCGLLVVEALALLVVLGVFGFAVGNAVRQTRGGSLPVPGLPSLSRPSDPCSPRPCMAHSGVTVLISDVNRSAGPASDGRSHLVRLRVTFVGTSGTHTVTSEEVALRDAGGSVTIAGADQAAAQCGDSATSTDVQAGQRAGPYTICFAVAGSASAALTLVWISPEDLSIVELQLP